MNLYRGILQDAAKHRLVVAFSGCSVPRGFERTYPNLLTVQAVAGTMEYQNNLASSQADIYTNAALLLPQRGRPLDYGPAVYSEGKYRRSASDAHALALSVLFESGIQFLSDSPEAYWRRDKEEQAFLQHLPVTWDETRLLKAHAGKKVILARRKGRDWYVAGVDGKGILNCLNSKSAT